MSLPRHYKTAEVAEMLSVGESTVRDLLHAGRLDAVRIGKDLRFSEDSIRAFLDANRVGTVATQRGRGQTRRRPLREVSNVDS